MKRLTYALLLTALFLAQGAHLASAQTSGCTDPAACNYDAATTADDGSCTDFQIPDPCPLDVNEDGVIGILDILDILGSYGQICAPE